MALNLRRASQPELGEERQPLTVFIRDYGIVISVAVLFIVLSLTSDVFFTVRNMKNILDQWSAPAIVAIGETLVIIAGGFDLSVGAVFAVSGVVAAKVAQDHGVEIGLLSGVAFGALLGVGNGLLTTVGRINPFIATLASSIMIRGLALAISGGLLIAVADDDFSSLGRGTMAGIKYSTWVFVVVFVFATILLARTRFGRGIYAAGGNAEAARLAGINVNGIRIITFALCGLCAGLAGVLIASRGQTGQADVGIGLELTAIAAVAIGGTSIFGGQGAIWRTVLGILLLALIGNGFNLLEVAPTYQQIFQGAIIVLAVGIDAWAKRAKA